MPQLIFGHDDIIKPWVCTRLDMQIPKDSTAIGIASKDRIIGGAVYHNYTIMTDGSPLFIEMSFATVDKRWAAHGIIRALLGYPFYQLKVKRIQSTVSRKNRDVRLFLERLGFKLEGVGRLAWPQGGDALMYSLLSREFFSSKWHRIGQINTIGSGSTRPSSDLGGADGQQSGYGSV